MGGGTVYGQLNPNTGTERGGTYGGATAATGTGMGTNPFRDSRQEGYDAPPGAGAVGTAGLVGAAGGAAYSAGRNDTTYDSGNLDSSDIGATSGPAQADTSGWSAGAGTGNTTRSGTNDLSTGSTGTELPPAQQNTADLIGPEPKWKNASSTVSAPDDTSLPPAGIDTQTSSGAISSEPSARTRAALASDPGSTTTHGVLGGQPKQTGEGQPIVDPLSTGANTDQQSGFGAAQGGQSAGGGAYGAGAGQGGYERGSSDPSQGTGFSGSTGTGTGGVSAEPTARTQAALGRGGY
ncbi:hypothetical protein CALVIDRAFT_409314 [Calocera viscosa TUFC12733]|uniref:Uncharacterized protein n=1 Tax=Calocera viscosa (strain TUFC12733) TaxID=1330018 RepID=A0A167G7V6_CALVF|nr:hypothetical protein CALVIDRAFT_409314 [Calocera viscosa TUFC12733]